MPADKLTHHTNQPTQSSLARYAANKLRNISPRDTVFFELRTGSQFSGEVSEIDSDGEFICIRQAANGNIIVIRLEEIAAFGLNCSWPPGSGGAMLRGQQMQQLKGDR